MKRLIITLMMVAVAFGGLGQSVNNSRGIAYNDGGTNTFSLLDGSLNLGTNTPAVWSAGRLSWDDTSQTILADTGIDGVRVNVGQERHVRVFNGTGTTITNGSVVNAFGATNDVLKVILADVSSPAFSSAILGLATHDIPDGTIGLVTEDGDVRDFDTSAFGVGGVIYASTNGTLTATRPQYPNVIFIMGSVIKSDATEGIFHVEPTRFSRNDISESYGFTSQGVTSGSYWKAGFYEWPATDANLSQALTNVVLGTSATAAKAAHIGIVANGAGTVDTGTVGIRVFGIMDMEGGAQVADQYAIITTNITLLVADEMIECSEKFSGQPEVQLYVSSGSPTTYSADFNYGFSKYTDLGNRDFTITGFECEWQGNAADGIMDVALLLHGTTGWTYAATGFVAGNGDVCRKTIDQALAGDIVNGQDGAYKRTNLDQFVDGNGAEGYIIQVVTGANNTIQTMDMHVTSLSEELVQ